jgi:hypothetical protein
VSLASLRSRLTYANVIASISLFIALGGTSYAVTQLPANSVGSPQVKNNSLFAHDLRKGQVAFSLGLGSDTKRGATGSGATCTIGEIVLTAGTVIGATRADGHEIQIADSPTLFSLIGTTYGGDGQTTFRVPDLRKLAPNHMTYGICEFGVFPTRRN